MSAATERVLAEVRESAAAIDSNEWTLVEEIREHTERARTWEAGVHRAKAPTHWANLRPILVSLAALCVAAIAALDAPAAGGGKA